MAATHLSIPTWATVPPMGTPTAMRRFTDLTPVAWPGPGPRRWEWSFGLEASRAFPIPDLLSDRHCLVASTNAASFESTYLPGSSVPRLMNSI